MFVYSMAFCDKITEHVGILFVTIYLVVDWVLIQWITVHKHIPSGHQRWCRHKTAFMPLCDVYLNTLPTGQQSIGSLLAVVARVWKTHDSCGGWLTTSCLELYI